MATAGNPFLLTELIGELRARHVEPVLSASTDGGLVAPLPVPAAVEGRIRALAPAAKEVVRAVAVLGQSADMRRCRRLVGVELVDVVRTVDRLVQRGVLKLDQRISFVHPLVRTAVLAEIPPGQASELHRAAARILVDDGTMVDELAAHLLRCLPVGDGWTARALCNAGRIMRTRGAPGEAARLYRRAIDEPPPGELRPAILLDLAESNLAADSPDTLDAYRRAIDGVGDDPALRCRARLGLARALSNAGRFSEAVDELERALEDVAGLPPVAAEVEAALANIARWDLSTRSQSIGYHRRLLERDDAGEELDRRLHLNMALDLMAEGVDRRRTARHLDLAHAGGELVAEHDAMWTSMLVAPLFTVGEGGMAHGLLDRVGAEAAANGWPAVTALVHSARSRLWLESGDLIAAEAEALLSLELGIAPMNRAFACAYLAQSRLERGEPREAWELLVAEQLVGELAPLWPYELVRAVRGRVRAALGDVVHAVADLEEHGRAAELFGLHNPVIEPWRSRLAWILLADGQRAGARSLRGARASPRTPWGTAAPIGRALCTYAVTLPRSDAVPLLQDAVELSSSAGARLDEAVALYHLGVVHRRHGKAVDARWCLYGALERASACAADVVERDVRAELVLLGRRPRRTAQSGADTLTATERRIADLAAAGLSNPEISSQLFVARRTVETHLTHVYAKLQIRSRRELTAAFSDIS